MPRCRRFRRPWRERTLRSFPKKLGAAANSMGTFRLAVVFQPVMRSLPEELSFPFHETAAETFSEPDAVPPFV